jgi:hypothetical protein
MGMNHRENYTQQTPVVIIATAALNADNTPAAVDLQGFDAATINIAVGVGGITFSGTNKVEFVLTHSDDDSTYTNVTDDDVITDTTVASGIIKSLVAAHAAASVEKIGYRGGKRYLKLLADFSGTHGTATPMGAVVVKGGAHFA